MRSESLTSPQWDPESSDGTPESGQLSPARKGFLGPRRRLEIERSLNPAFHYRDNKKGGGGLFLSPARPRRPASSPPYAAMGGEPATVRRAFSLRS
jgi:hypothetical protein